VNSPVCLFLCSLLCHCWLGIRKGIQPVKKPSDDVLAWLSVWTGAMCKQYAYGLADAIATPSSLASFKSKMVCLSCAGLPRLSWKRGHEMDLVCFLDAVQYFNSVAV